MVQAAVSTKKLKTTTSPKKSTSVRKIKPTAQLPTAAVLGRMSDQDRDILNDILFSEQVYECVYHPSFRRTKMPGTEATPAEQHQHISPEAAEHDSTEVLTADEERNLFLQFNYCRHRVMRILRAHRGKRLTARAARETIRWQRQALEIRTDIVRANTSLVLAMARRSRNSGVDIGELVSEGNLALIRCVDKFDAARGFKFSTYACRAILASFSRAGTKAARYRLQFPTTYDPALERSDHLDRRREHIEHECVDELKRIMLDNAADLSNVERRVLDARFSLNAPDMEAASARRKTLDQVGDLLGVSKERVRQIQNQAMRKLRDVLEDRLLIA
jgi:RNA polymerase sigma factor (sigma-70 family)